MIQTQNSAEGTGRAGTRKQRNVMGKEFRCAAEQTDVIAPTEPASAFRKKGDAVQAKGYGATEQTGGQRALPREQYWSDRKRGEHSAKDAGRGKGMVSRC